MKKLAVGFVAAALCSVAAVPAVAQVALSSRSGQVGVQFGDPYGYNGYNDYDAYAGYNGRYSGFFDYMPGPDYHAVRHGRRHIRH